LHIATVVLPAVLAEAERRNLSGETLLDALAAGYATAVGLSRQFSLITTPRGLRSTCLYAGMGAAVAVSRLFGHGPEGVANTLGLASQSSFGTTQCWHDGSDEYQLHVANAASQALLCSELTEGGVMAGDHSLDGPSGFYPALTGVTPRYVDIAPDFEPNAAIVETVLKRYPVSGICQPLVRLSERLAEQLKGRLVKCINIEMNTFEMNYPGTLNAGPMFKSFSDRLMSARFCVGSVLEAGRFDFDAFLKPASISLLRLISVTEVRANVDLGTLSCRINITMQTGPSVHGELLDGSKDLAINWDTVDPWALALWQEAGRGSAYSALRTAVIDLPNGGIAPLMNCL
jgi:2-methylcitrate dehydratase PrpD